MRAGFGDHRSSRGPTHRAPGYLIDLAHGTVSKGAHVEIDVYFKHRLIGNYSILLRRGDSANG